MNYDMNLHERVLQEGTKEYKNMKAVASMLEAVSPNNYIYEVRDTYLDYGQDWKWTTICRGDVQVLNPIEWKEILMATTVDELAQMVEQIRAGMFFKDK